MFENVELRFDRTNLRGAADVLEAVESRLTPSALRWSINRVDEASLRVEATLHHGGRWPLREAPPQPQYTPRSAVLSLIPTGVGCEIGGYAGDAAPVSALLAACADYLITNPNAVNASAFIQMPRNLVYTEGYWIDAFCRGEVNLSVPTANRVGLVIEKASDDTIQHIFNVVNAVRAVHGIDIEDCIITERELGSRCRQTPSGCYVGALDRPEVLLEACSRLVQRGVDAIAVCSQVRDLPPAAYAEHFSGSHPNPVGGAEALISHFICRHFGIPAAHAPIINFRDFALHHPVVDARGEGEHASHSGLACVLIGLKRAPQCSPHPVRGAVDVLGLSSLRAVVAPATCMGGAPVLHALKQGIPVIAVKANRTILGVDAQSLGLEGVIEVENYTEAAGILLAMREGISIGSLYRPFQTLRPVQDATQARTQALSATGLRECAAANNR